jgi:hypothetical protein
MKFYFLLAISTLMLMPIASLFSADLMITYKAKSKALLVFSSSTTLVEYHSTNYKRVDNQKSKVDAIYDYNNFIRYTIVHKKSLFAKSRWMI